ncbi:MAG: VOC family protein [Mycolicibacterium rufum]|nr:VOC family protein [Mycolicibacterium rufum]
MTTPPLLHGIHHLKLPVTDLPASIGWYQRVFGAVHVDRFDHYDGAGNRYAVILEIPGLDTALELRWAPQAANAIRGYDPVSFIAGNHHDLAGWLEHLDALGVEHSPVITALAGELVVFRDPDGTYLRVLTMPEAGFDSIQMSGAAEEPSGPWLVPDIMRWPSQRGGRQHSAETVRTVAIQRFTMVTRRRFDDVLQALREGVGHASDLASLVQRWNTAATPDELERITVEAQGSSGLIEFLTLDLGAVLAVRYPQRQYRLVRLIIGNPVTMSDMTVSTPDAGSYAPVTILAAERPDGVHLSYDSVASAIAGHDEPSARAVAQRLDASVMELMRQAAG